MSQAQLAHAAGLDPKTIHWIEHGHVKNPRWGTISALAEVLGIQPAVLGRLIARGVDKDAA